jgi:hypothetical protein
MKKKVTKKKVTKLPRKQVKKYTIDDPIYGEFVIQYKDNPWWADKEKVVKLIQGYKMDCKPGELRILVGISNDQLDYFLKEHVELSEVLSNFRNTPVLKARATVVKAISTDVNTAFKYLERKASEEFRERKDIEFSKKPSLVEGMFSDDDEK